MDTIQLAESRERPAVEPVEVVIVAEIEVNGKRLGISESGGAHTRALVRYSAKREKFARTSKLADIADALDAGLIG